MVSKWVITYLQMGYIRAIRFQDWLQNHHQLLALVIRIDFLWCKDPHETLRIFRFTTKIRRKSAMNKNNLLII